MYMNNSGNFIKRKENKTQKISSITTRLYPIIHAFATTPRII